MVARVTRLTITPLEVPIQTLFLNERDQVVCVMCAMATVALSRTMSSLVHSIVPFAGQI